MKGSDTILGRLLDLHPKRIDLSLGRILRLAEKLGNPQNDLPPIIHVAGTNGKGSFIAFLGAILQAAGFSVASYTSPHLCNFAERIAFDGVPISEADLSRHLKTCEDANAGEPITFFEITTLAAFLAYRQRKCDILLLEVGLGGEFDATNIIPAPLLSVITPISHDHHEFLGNTISDIAKAKAGIIKRDVPVIAMQKFTEAEAVITDTAKKNNAPLMLYGKDFDLQNDNIIYQQETYPLPYLSLVGNHQKYNATLVYGAVRILQDKLFAITERDMQQGFATATWAGRLQNLKMRQLEGGEGWDIYLDGGHNTAAAEILATWAEAQNEKLHVIFGMQNNKDASGFLQRLKPFIGELLCVPIDSSDNSFSPIELSAIASGLDINSFACDNLAHALKILQHQKPAKLLICGSLYLAGDVLNSQF